MTYIIFDLEWVTTYNRRQVPEIISIGAVKLEERNGKLVETGRFDEYVRPARAKKLNKRTVKLTGISLSDVSTKEQFPQVWKRFVRWIGEEEYALLSWGTEDIRTIIRNCKHHRVPLDWLRNYNDLQAEFGRLYELKNQLGLMPALELLNLQPIGHHHSAIDDSRNTAEIFKAIFKRLDLQKNNHVQVQKKYGPKPARHPARPKTGTGTARKKPPSTNVYFHKQPKRGERKSS